MPAKSSVCGHPRRSEIDRRLADPERKGNSVRALGAEFGLNPQAIHRHRKHHLARALTRAAARRVARGEDTLYDLLLTSRRRRLEILEDFTRCILALARERGQMMADVPGGKTGLLTEVPHREGIEYRFDRALAAELREISKQAAQECGQWAQAGNVAQHQQAIIILPSPGPDARLPATPREAAVFDVGPLPSTLPAPVVLDGAAEDLEPEYPALPAAELEPGGR